MTNVATCDCDTITTKYAFLQSFSDSPAGLDFLIGLSIIVKGVSISRTLQGINGTIHFNCVCVELNCRAVAPLAVLHITAACLSILCSQLYAMVSETLRYKPLLEKLVLIADPK